MATPKKSTDTERLDWLTENHKVLWPTIRGWIVFGPAGSGEDRTAYKSPRAAIDAAKKERKNAKA